MQGRPRVASRDAHPRARRPDAHHSHPSLAKSVKMRVVMPAPLSAASGSTTPHLILFDGTCGFCAGWVRFVLRRDAVGAFHFASLQSDAGQQALSQCGRASDDLTTVYVIESYRSGHARCLTRSDAAAFIASQLGGLWALAGAVLKVVPAGVRDAVYDLVARYRHHLSDGSAACIVPTPEQRTRFLDYLSEANADPPGSSG